MTHLKNIACKLIYKLAEIHNATTIDPRSTTKQLKRQQKEDTSHGLQQTKCSM